MNLTPDQFAELIKAAKPHLIEIEEEIGKLEYGEVTIKLTVRAGQVVKMIFHEERTWLKDKATN